MLSYPFLTNLVSNREQTRLGKEFRSPEFRSRTSTAEVAPGHVVMRIVIPSINVDALVVEGTDPKALRAGAGRYLSTVLPCKPGNVGIAGHRNIYGKPFLRLDELKAGDTINLVTPDQTCSYRVVDGPKEKRKPRRGAAGWITSATDAGVIGQLPGSMLTLTTCHPKNRATARLIVRAQLAG
jgi:sortase (surface protein transpeptidase)